MDGNSLDPDFVGWAVVKRRKQPGSELQAVSPVAAVYDRRQRIENSQYDRRS